MSVPALLSVVIRDATESDMPAIQAIYAHHVLHGIATFENVPPDAQEMLLRFRRISEQGMPYLAACREDKVVGYCYASTYRPRHAYRFTVEDTVYLAPDAQGKGVGRRLLQALIERCAAGPWRQMVAVISGEGSEASIALHRKLGFTAAGTLHAVGHKHGRWIDTVLMQRDIGPGAAQPPTSAYGG